MKLTWLDDGSPCSVEDLAAANVHYQRLSTDPAVYEPALAALSTERRYITRDEVALEPTTPNLDGLLAKFETEHLHTEDEVRFVLSGSGIFDIRSKDDRFMRVVVEPGDLLVVPTGCYHRFTLTGERHIRCCRLFQDAAGWTPVYRETAEPTKSASV